MKLAVTGKPTKVTVLQCRKALRYYAKRLLTPHLYEIISVKLIFVDSLPTKADCIWEDTPRHGRSFIIRVRSSLGPRITLQCLAHEMVHVMQFAKGKLKDFWTDPNSSSWEGKKIYIRCDDDYWIAPWEIEAYGREIGLYRTYIKELKYGNSKRLPHSKRRRTYRRARR